MTQRERRTDGRFAPGRSDQELLAIVRQVARAIEADEPLGISQSTYDKARSEAGLSQSPKAFRIARRLKLSWPEVLKVALESKNPGQELSAKSKLRVRDDLTKAEVVHYLKLVAKHLGVDELSRGDYDEGRIELVRADARKHSAGQGVLIPTGQMIVSTAKTWENALAWAGLHLSKKSSRTMYPAEKAIDDFIEDFGFLPSLRQLNRYQTIRGLATSGIPTGSHFVAWRNEQMASGLASRHGDLPEPRGGRRTDLDPAKISPAPAGYSKRGGEPATIERARRDIGIALDLTGGNLTQRDYVHLVPRHGLLSLNGVQAAGKRAGGLTWGQIRDQVIEERSKGGRRGTV